eukprot:3824433-Alexandrium_andersonii.AAC.1
MHVPAFGSRYVDDMLLWSGTLCKKCLERQLHRVYPVAFDVQESVAGCEAWLGMLLSPSHEGCVVYMEP